MPLVEQLLDESAKEAKDEEGGGGAQNFHGVSPLMIALEKGHLEVAEAILRKGGNCMKETDNKRDNVFHYAFASPKPEKASQFLLKQGLPQRDLRKLLMGKNLLENSPLHTLAEQRNSGNVLTKFANQDILACMTERNLRGNTPLHIAAERGHRSFVDSILEISKSDLLLMERLLEKANGNGNTVLHLAVKRIQDYTKGDKLEDTVGSDVLRSLIDFLEENRLEAAKFLNIKNSEGKTPFSKAVANDQFKMVSKMLKIVNNNNEKNQLLNETSNKEGEFPLHVAARRGHVKMFNLLLDNGADILKGKGTNGSTPLDVAINEEQRDIIRAIINAKGWKEAFQKPSSTSNNQLDTPLRKLVRKLPEMAEELLDKCLEKDCKKEPHQGKEEEDIEEVEKVVLVQDLVEDIENYEEIVMTGNTRKRFCERNKDEEEEEVRKSYDVGVDNHPMMIMAAKKRWDLLLHPLCLAIIT